MAETALVHCIQLVVLSSQYLTAAGFTMANPLGETSFKTEPHFKYLLMLSSLLPVAMQTEKPQLMYV